MIKILHKVFGSINVESVNVKGSKHKYQILNNSVVDFITFDEAAGSVNVTTKATDKAVFSQTCKDIIIKHDDPVQLRLSKGVVSIKFDDNTKGYTTNVLSMINETPIGIVVEGDADKQIEMIEPPSTEDKLKSLAIKSGIDKFGEFYIDDQTGSECLIIGRGYNTSELRVSPKTGNIWIAAGHFIYQVALKELGWSCIECYSDDEVIESIKALEKLKEPEAKQPEAQHDLVLKKAAIAFVERYGITDYTIDLDKASGGYLVTPKGIDSIRSILINHSTTTFDLDFKLVPKVAFDFVAQHNTYTVEGEKITCNHARHTRILLKDLVENSINPKTEVEVDLKKEVLGILVDSMKGVTGWSFKTESSNGKWFGSVEGMYLVRYITANTKGEYSLQCYHQYSDLLAEITGCECENDIYTSTNKDEFTEIAIKFTKAAISKARARFADSINQCKGIIGSGETNHNIVAGSKLSDVWVGKGLIRTLLAGYSGNVISVSSGKVSEFKKVLSEACLITYFTDMDENLKGDSSHSFVCNSDEQFVLAVKAIVNHSNKMVEPEIKKPEPTKREVAVFSASVDRLGWIKSIAKLFKETGKCNVRAFKIDQYDDTKGYRLDIDGHRKVKSIYINKLNHWCVTFIDNDNNDEDLIRFLKESLDGGEPETFGKCSNQYGNNKAIYCRDYVVFLDAITKYVKA